MSDEPVRIARFLARAGVTSRRNAEKMIEEGRVKVNGQVLTSLHRRVSTEDDIRIDGKCVAAPEPPMLWRFHKPAGFVTTTSDEKGRPNVFDLFPPEMPRVLTVGRLDLNSEGLLLLTNDGGLKRRLELPSNGFPRGYRVRARGRPSAAALDRLRRGIRIGTERFRPMTVHLERQNSANCWLNVQLMEGRNREIRRAFSAIGLTVSRLIRVSFGPFQLGRLASGNVRQVSSKVFFDVFPDLVENGRDRKLPTVRTVCPGRGGRTAMPSRQLEEP